MSGGSFKCVSGQLDDVFTDWGKKLQILVKLRQKKVWRGERKQQKNKGQQSVSLRAPTQMCASPALDGKSVTASRSEELASN